jgi:hypothetical protein
LTVSEPSGLAVSEIERIVAPQAYSSGVP